MSWKTTEIRGDDDICPKRLKPKESTIVDEDPDHPILAQPWKYRVVGFSYQLAEDGSSYIDLSLERDSVIRRLRFINPQDIELELGWPQCPGLQFKDVSMRQLDRLRVRVTDVEGASQGAMRFWAQDVIDLDDSG